MAIHKTRLKELHDLLEGAEYYRCSDRVLDYARDFAPLLQQDAIDAVGSTASGGEPASALSSLIAKFDELRPEKNFGDDASDTFKERHVVFRASGIKKAYRSFRRRGFELNVDVDIELRAGEVTGLVGKNGSGKTTLLRIIAGELAHDSGKLEYPGIIPGAPDWRKIKPCIAYVPQRPPRWYSNLEQSMRFTASMNEINGPRNELDTEFFLHRLRLSDYRYSKWKELTGGFLTRFELAKAMVSDPDLVVLDEPLAPLDIGAMQQFLNNIRDFARAARKPLPVIVSSQHIYEIESVADRLMMLDGGNVSFYGSTGELGERGGARVYELRCDATKDMVEKALSAIGLIGVSEKGNNLNVKLVPDAESKAVLRALLAADIRVQYFRDISDSTRKLFDDEVGR